MGNERLFKGMYSHLDMHEGDLRATLNQHYFARRDLLGTEEPVSSADEWQESWDAVAWEWQGDGI